MGLALVLACGLLAQDSAERVVVDGEIRSMPGVRLLLDADDGRLIPVILSGDTQFTIPRSELRVGARVRIVAERKARGRLHAVEVLEAGERVAPPPPPRPQPQGAEPATERVVNEPEAGPTPEEEELRRPVLRRRTSGDKRDLEYVDDPDFGADVRQKAKRQREAGSEQGIRGAVEPVISPESLHEDPLIGKAILAAAEFSNSVPDFIAEQYIERFRSGNNGRNWKLRDTVTMDVLYADEKEFYQNVTLNGRESTQIEVQNKGQWSRGEWFSALVTIMRQASEANFKLEEEVEENGRQASVYTFYIPAENSRWKLMFASVPLQPAYRGRLWLEEETGRIMRLEQEALDIPYEYPFNKVELIVDYDDVVIDGKRYWMPVRSQNLGCQRGSNNCGRNDVLFRNYRKFTAASSVFHTDSTVDFGGGKQGGSGVEPPVISEPEGTGENPRP